MERIKLHRETVHPGNGRIDQGTIQVTLDSTLGRLFGPGQGRVIRAEFVHHDGTTSLYTVPDHE